MPVTEADYAEILFADKHTTIEGIAAEVFTEMSLLVPILEGISRFGWWFDSTSESYNATALSKMDHVDLRSLPEFERTIAAKVRTSVKNMSVALFSEKSLTCYSAKTGSIKPSTGRALQSHLMSTVTGPLDRDARRLEKALAWLKQHELLSTFGVQRLYANFFAPRYIWDIDYLGMYKGRVIAFDIKHKYPSHDGQLGANGAISKLYEFLSRQGILVVYIVLLKPKQAANESPVDLLRGTSSKWLACNAQSFASSEDQLKNKSGTGLAGDVPGNSRSISIEKFRTLQTPEDLRSFLDDCLDGVESKPT